MAGTAPRSSVGSALDSPRGARGGAAVRVGLGLVLLLAAGCPEKKFEFAADEKPSGPPVPLSQPTAASAGSPSDAGAAGEPAVSKPTVVVLRRWREKLVALACYDATTRSLRAGDSCAALIPAATEVRINDAATVRMRRAAPLTCRTPGGAVSHPAFALSDGPPGDAGPNPGPPLAIWSSGGAPKLELPPAPPEALPLPPSESNTIRSSSRNLLPLAQRALLGPVAIDNVWSVDLDADGLRERLDQVRVLDQRERFAMITGVYVVAGKDAVALRPLRIQLVPSPDRERLGRDDHSYEVKLLAAIDLDHDGRRELWLQVIRPGLTTDSMGRYTDTGLAVFSELTCQTAEPEPPPPAVPPPVPAVDQPPIPR